MVVENHRDQAHCQNQTARDPPPQLEPQRVKGYFLAQPLSLSISAEEIVRKNCQHGAEKKFKHAQLSFSRVGEVPDLLKIILHLPPSPLHASQAALPQLLWFVWRQPPWSLAAAPLRSRSELYRRFFRWMPRCIRVRCQNQGSRSSQAAGRQPKRCACV